MRRRDAREEPGPTRRGRAGTWLRRGAATLAALAVLGGIVFVAVDRYRARDHLQSFREHKGRLVAVVESPGVLHAGGRVHEVRLTDDRGLEVRVTLKVPSTSAARHPVLVTLGGVRSGGQAIEYLGNTGDFIVLAVDYPYAGPRSSMSVPEFLARVPAMRRAMLDTVPATMLALDYLGRRDDVDHERVVLAGGSFGALFAPAVAAADERITALAIFFGAGDLAGLVDTVIDLPLPVRRPVAWLAATLVSPMEPLKYIGRVAPRPVFMLNGTADARMPERYGRLLHDAAGEPKTVRWMPVGHVNLRAPEFRREVVGAFVDWLEELRYLSSEEAARLRSAASQ